MLAFDHLIEDHCASQVSSVLDLLRSLMLLPLIGTMNGFVAQLILMAVRQRRMMMMVCRLDFLGLSFVLLVLVVSLKNVLCLFHICRFDHFLVYVPRGENAQAPLHVDVDDL